MFFWKNHRREKKLESERKRQEWLILNRLKDLPDASINEYDFLLAQQAQIDLVKKKQSDIAKRKKKFSWTALLFQLFNSPGLFFLNNKKRKQEELLHQSGAVDMHQIHRGSAVQSVLIKGVVSPNASPTKKKKVSNVFCGIIFLQ